MSEAFYQVTRLSAVAAAQGRQPFDLLLTGGEVLDVATLELREADIGIVGPMIRADDGSLDFSQRRFPRLRSTFARALFVHRLLPHAIWTDEMIRDHGLYERARSAEWLSGACLLVRRETLEVLTGWDEGFFLYCEDKDLCKRAWAAGYSVRYEPTAKCVHVGGASAPRDSGQRHRCAQ